MTHERDIERLLDYWLSDGPTQSPDRVMDVVADRIERQPQRPAWRLDWRHTTMTPTLKFGAAIAAVIVIGIVGFGLFRGGGDSAVGAPGAGSSASPTIAPSAPPPTSTLTPTPAAPSSSAAVLVDGACDLMTADEAREALHISALVSAGSLGVDSPTTPSRYCGFESEGKTVFDLAYEKENGANIFAIWKKGTGVVAVSGLGDAAVWNPALTTLYILKADRLVTIEPEAGPSPTLTLKAVKALGAIVVPRM